MQVTELLQKLLDEYNSLRSTLHKAMREKAPWPNPTGALWKDADELRIRMDWLLDKVEEINPQDAIEFRKALDQIVFDGHLDVVRVESDTEFQNRILERLPPGAVYTAEDLGNTFGQDLDRFGRYYGLKRNFTPTPKK